MFIIKTIAINKNSDKYVCELWENNKYIKLIEITYETLQNYRHTENYKIL